MKESDCEIIAVKPYKNAHLDFFFFLIQCHMANASFCKSNRLKCWNYSLQQFICISFSCVCLCKILHRVYLLIRFDVYITKTIIFGVFWIDYHFFPARHAWWRSLDYHHVYKVYKTKMAGMGKYCKHILRRCHKLFSACVLLCITTSATNLR